MNVPELLAQLDPRALDTLRAVGVFVAATCFFLALRAVLLGQFHRWAARTSTTVDDLVLQAVRTPSLFWCVAGGVDVTLRVSPVSDEVRDVGGRALLVLVILSATLVAANVAGGLVTHVLRRQAPDARVPGLGQAVIKSTILLIGGMIVLNAVGVQIAPLLTALGVGGLAVALALQDTLTNFFAGIHILLERPFHIGHFIKLEDGRDGHVIDIGWRTTRIRTVQDDVVVVPNSKIAGSTIVNFHMPIPRSRVDVPVGVAYGSDPEHVRRVLVEEALAMAGEGGPVLADPPPQALLRAFGDSSLDFQLRLFVDDVANGPPVVDRLLRRLFARFHAEGIEIPFPTRTVLVRREEGAAG